MRKMEEARVKEREADGERRQGRKEKEGRKWERMRKKRDWRELSGKYIEAEKVSKCRDRGKNDPAISWGFLKAMLGPSVLWPGVQIAQSLPPAGCTCCFSQAVSLSTTLCSPLPTFHVLPARGAQCPCWWCSRGSRSWSHGWSTCCPQSLEAWPSLPATCHCRASAVHLLPPPPPPSLVLRHPGPLCCPLPPLHWLLHPPGLNQRCPGQRVFGMRHVPPCGIGDSWWDQRLLSQQWAGPSPEEGSQESCAVGKALGREMIVLKRENVVSFKKKKRHSSWAPVWLLGF